jgi:hypothetical protein
MGTATEDTQWKLLLNAVSHVAYAHSTENSLGSGYGLEDVCSITGKGISFSTTSKRILSSTQPPIQWISECISLRVKLHQTETNHLPPFSAEIKSAWILTSILISLCVLFVLLVAEQFHTCRI